LSGRLVCFEMQPEGRFQASQRFPDAVPRRSRALAQLHPNVVPKQSRAPPGTSQRVPKASKLGAKIAGKSGAAGDLRSSGGSERRAEGELGGWQDKGNGPADDCWQLSVLKKPCCAWTNRLPRPTTRRASQRFLRGKHGPGPAADGCIQFSWLPANFLDAESIRLAVRHLVEVAHSRAAPSPGQLEGLCAGWLKNWIGRCR
jgi:hypothetical protein